MKKNILALWLLIFCSFNGVAADQVSCERIENYSGFGLGDWKTCFMYQRTEINSADTTIASRDESIQGLYFYENKKIKFLPVGLSEKFPNLGALGAGGCSLTTISKANFKGLSKLRALSLSNNQIEKITSEAFNDLVALEILHLFDNNLKFINGKAFARLNKLTYVDLRLNQCINEDFNGASRIAVLQQTVNEKCSFDELENSSVETSTVTTTTVSSLADKKCENSQDLTNLTTTIERMKAETSEIISKLNEQKEKYESIAKALEAQSKTFEAQTKAMEAQVKTCKDQQTLFNETLASKTSEIIESNKKLAESESQVMLKMSENGKLTDDLQRKEAEIIENREKIKKLEKRNECLSNPENCN